MKCTSQKRKSYYGGETLSAHREGRYTDTTMAVQQQDLFQMGCQGVACIRTPHIHHTFYNPRWHLAKSNTPYLLGNHFKSTGTGTENPTVIKKKERNGKKKKRKINGKNYKKGQIVKHRPKFS